MLSTPNSSNFNISNYLNILPIFDQLFMEARYHYDNPEYFFEQILGMVG
jgi:hypothetical protein